MPSVTGRPSSGNVTPTLSSHPIDVARLAHELRTPLNVIAVLSELMRGEQLGPLGSPRYRTYAADIHESVAHANRVLASYLDPAPGGGTSGPLEFIELEIGPHVEGAVSALAPLAERMGLVLRHELSAGLPHLIADRRVLRQIVNNLVTNALKFTAPGGEVVVAVRYQPNVSLQIEVSDTGDGMTADELAAARGQARITEPLRRRSGGTGIGLPLVRSLATASGANLAIDSTLHVGTRVCVTFPPDRIVPA